MNSAVDLSTNSATISHQTRVAESPSQTPAYFWIALAFFGLAMIGGAVAGSHYPDIAAYVGP